MTTPRSRAITTFLGAGALLIPTLFPGALHAAGHELRFAPEVGKTYRFVTEQEQKVDMKIAGMDQAMNTNSRMEVSHRIVERDRDGVSTVAMTIDRMTLATRQGDNVIMQFDSDDEQAGGGGPMDMLGAVVGHEMSLRFSPRGEITGISGMATVWDEMQAAADPAAKAMFDAVRESMSDEAMSQMMQASLPVFPEKPVAEGESWQHESRMNNPLLGAMKIDNTFTLEGTETRDGIDCWRLGVAMKMSFDGDMPLFAQMAAATGGDMKMDFDDVESQGKMWVARATGITVASELEQNIGMRMTTATAASDQPPQEMRISVLQHIRQYLAP